MASKSKTEDLTVTLELKAVSVKINADPNNTEELLKLAQKAFIEQIQKKFPFYQYSIDKGNVLTFETIKPGLVVYYNDKKEIGIVTEINKKSVNVSLTNSRVLQTSPQAFTIADDINIEEIMWVRDTKDYWSEGDTGFLVASDQASPIPVVIGKSTRGITKVIPINGSGGSYKLNEKQMNILLFDIKADAEKKLAKSNKK